MLACSIRSPPLAQIWVRHLSPDLDGFDILRACAWSTGCDDGTSGKCFFPPPLLCACNVQVVSVSMCMPPLRVDVLLLHSSPWFPLWNDDECCPGDGRRFAWLSWLGTWAPCNLLPTVHYCATLCCWCSQVLCPPCRVCCWSAPVMDLSAPSRMCTWWCLQRMTPPCVQRNLVLSCLLLLLVWCCLSRCCPCCHGAQSHCLCCTVLGD
jgi:hypothetical protein